MPPSSTTGRTPLTLGPNTYAIDSLRRTVNPISATNLFPDETPDTDRVSSTTEPAHFSDIDEDDPSPHDDEPPSIDDDVPVVHVATDTGGVDTGDTAPAPHTDMTIGDTSNPTGTHSTMPTEPSGDTHVIDSYIAASPTFDHFSGIDEDDPSPHDDAPPSMDDDVPVINVTTGTTELHQDVDTDPSPTVTVPPTAQHISSFLLHVRRHPADDATSSSPGVPVDTADGPTAIAAPAADTDDDTTRKRKRNRRGGGPTRAKEQRRREAYNTASNTPAIEESGREHPDPTPGLGGGM